MIYGLHKNPAFSQVVATSGRTRTVYVGGQNAVDSSGTIVGNGDAHRSVRCVRGHIMALSSHVVSELEQMPRWNWRCG